MALTVSKKKLGQVANADVWIWHLDSQTVGISVISYGATLCAVRSVNKDGVKEDIALGFDNAEQYAGAHPYFGSTVGRVSNRTAKGKFTLEGKEYSLPINNGPNHLHGGPNGFHHQNWSEESLVLVNEHTASLTLSYTSPDGEEGYPGKMHASTTYTLHKDGSIHIDWHATADQATPVNMTNHVYWNLAGAKSKHLILDHSVQILADRYLPVDSTLIPTGIQNVSAAPAMDFLQPHTVGSRIEQTAGGYDHCYILNHASNTQYDVRVTEPTSGRVLEVKTTQPAIQFYSGNFLAGLVGRDGVSFVKHKGFCLEPQGYVDALNHPEFPSIVLRPGAEYKHSMDIKLSVHK